jgi:LDH2 family malate/lactate/ureidoglycolate dehydrogenase
MSRVDTAIQQVHNTRKAPGIERTWMPGEREYDMREHNRALGIPLSEETLNDLIKTAKAVGVNLLHYRTSLNG